MPEFGSGPDTLVLKMSADLFEGSPRFNLYVIQNGGYRGNEFEWQTATSAKGSGGDTFTIHGDWPTDSAIGITYINDVGPRALYLDSATINGTPIAGADLDMVSNGEWGLVPFNGNAVAPTPTPTPVPTPTPTPVPTPTPTPTPGETLRGTSAANTLTGGAGDDRLNGLGGADTIAGGPGNDALFGGTGDDKMDGGAGNDWLLGDNGADALTGGAGADTFVIGGLNQGADSITDFNSGDGDRLDLHAVLGAYGHNYADLSAGGYVRLVTSGSNTRVEVDEDTGADTFTLVVTLQNVAVADLGSNWLIA